MDEDWFRRITAANAAHAALIANLLTLAMRGLTASEARAMGDELIKNATDTSSATGVTRGDEAASERYADMTVQSHQHVAELVNVAVGTIERVERERGR